MLHRFTLLKPGAKRPTVGDPNPGVNGNVSPTKTVEAGWNPLDLFFSSGLLVAKCDICMKRIGWKPVLECDDCGLRSVILTRCCVSFKTLLIVSCPQDPCQMWGSSAHGLRFATSDQTEYLAIRIAVIPSKTERQIYIVSRKMITHGIPGLYNYHAS